MKCATGARPQIRRPEMFSPTNIFEVYFKRFVWALSATVLPTDPVTPAPQGLHRRSRHNIPPFVLIFIKRLVSTKLLSVHSCMLSVHLFFRLPLLFSVHNMATKGPFTIGGIPDGIPRGIALVQWVHIYLFLRDTRAVRERYRARSLRERFLDISIEYAQTALVKSWHIRKIRSHSRRPHSSSTIMQNSPTSFRFSV